MQEDIMAVRKEADYVVVIIHGGVEYYQYPTPRMKRWYRHFVDLGADVVINHHQHCMCGYEVYNEKPIFYGLGNFYFAHRVSTRQPLSWEYGYAVNIIFDKDVEYEIIPYRQRVDGITIRDKDEFEKEIDMLNLPIPDDYLLQQKFDEYLLDMEYNLKVQMLPSVFNNRIGLGLARRQVFGNLYSTTQVYNLCNKLNCESHNEKIARLFEILAK